VQQPAGAGIASPAEAAAVVPREPPPEADPQAVISLSPQDVERRVAGHLIRGRQLLASEQWQELRKEMRTAMALDPFNLQVRELADRAQARIDEQEKLLHEFGEVRRMYDQHDYQSVLWKLYRMPRDSTIGDVDRFIRNAWYNWAAMSMKSGNNQDALEKIGEALASDPKDAPALKLQAFAQRYASRAKDALYFAFAEELALRSIDQE
jgi:tetratricopeptide (TPR) repeat protein